MKHFTLLTLLLALSLSAGAENYFKEGTKWIEETYGTGDGKNGHLVTTWLGQETEYAGRKCMPMYKLYDGDASSQILATYIYTDGEKVYFLPSSVSTQWALLYDFGLELGASCNVSGIPYPWNEKSDAYTYSSLVEYYEATEALGLPAMKMKEYDPQTKNYLGEGVWIKGIGSTMGVDHNRMFEAAGGGGKLLEVTTSGGACVYKLESGIEQTMPTAMGVMVNGNKVELTGLAAGASVKLYSIDGTCVSQMRASEGQAELSAPAPGVYLLKTPAGTVKVVLK